MAGRLASNSSARVVVRSRHAGETKHFSIGMSSPVRRAGRRHRQNHDDRCAVRKHQFAPAQNFGTNGRR